MTFAGLYVPLITPFSADGSVALDALEALAHSVLDAGAVGLVALGTTAEPASLTTSERAAVVDLVAAVCRDRSVQLIVGDPDLVPPSTAGLLSLVLPFIRPGEAGVIAWFTRLAAASSVPLVVYDIPHRTAQHLGVAALREIAALSGVAAVKYSPGSINADTIALLADPPPGFAILGGDDVFISPLLALGAHGAILASAHVDTASFVTLVDLWRDGRTAKARTLGGRLAGLSAALFAEPNPTVIKAVLHAQGRIPTPSVRLPLVPAGAGATAAALRLVASVSQPDACVSQ